MSSKASSSLKELKGLREAVLAEEKVRTQALLQNLPEGPSELLAAEEAALSAQVDQQSEELEESEAPAAPSVERSSVAQPVPSRQPVSRPAAPAVNRPKTNKESALIIPLTPKIQERLQRNVEDARWSPAELVMELIRVTLHQGYPAIQYGDQVIAKSGTYRTYERNPLETTLKIIGGLGVFSVSIKEENAEYQHWLSYFAEQKAGDPEKAAQQVCLFALQSHLESMEDFKPEGWIKNISRNAYSVVPTS